MTAIRHAALAAILAAGTATAQPAPPTLSSVIVRGVGIVETPPDAATLSFSIRGEGPTADAATRMLVDRQKAVAAGLTGLFVGKLSIDTGTVALATAHAGDCDSNDDGIGRAKLSEGACRVTGYVATLSTIVTTSAVRQAGTAAGLAARLGATDARVTGYALSNDATARRQATAAALGDARAQADAIAAAAHARIDHILSVRNDDVPDDDPNMVEVTGARAAPPVVAPPPIAIDLSPAPIETTVRLNVVYALGS